MTLLPSSRPQLRLNIRLVITIALTFAVGYIALRAVASGTFAQFELEAASVSGQATVTNNTAASGGKLLTFGNGASPAPPSTPVPTPTPTPTPTPPPNPIISNSLCRVDASLATDLISVAQNMASTCLTSFPKIEQILSPSPFAPPHVIALTNTTYAIAFTVNNEVQVQIAYIRTQPGDMGMIVHELTHVVQSYPSGGPGWITEGIADYVRYQLGYQTSWSYYHCDSVSKYTSGYNCGATFLHYVQTKYDSNIIKEINTAMKAGTYTDALFSSKTGKTPDQLYAACLLADCIGGKP